MNFKSFKDIEAMLTSRGQRKIGNNTYLRRRDAKTIGLQYHETDVVTFTPSGLTLTSGGWRTVTTKERINWALEAFPGLTLWQHKGEWYLSNAYANEWKPTEQTPVFHDGIRISYRGTIQANVRTQSKETKRRARIMKLIGAYLRDFAWDKCGDGGGDCWYCKMITEDGEPLGDAVEHTDHLESHLKEKYYMTSLVVNALKYSGYGDTAITMFCLPEYRELNDADQSHVKRAMRKYFKGMLLDRTGE